MARILIAGCGKLGMTLGQELSAEGHHVTGLKRHPPKPQPGFDFFQADLADLRSLTQLPANQDLVLVILSPDSSSEDTYRRTYVEALRNLMAVFVNTDSPPPFIYVSSTSVYGQTQGEWVDEQSVTRPSGYRGSILLEAEQLLHDNGADHTVIRFSGIYDRHSRYLLDRARQGAMIQHTPPYYSNRIHRQDCVGILKHLAELKLAGKSTANLYLGSDDEPAPMWDVITYLATLQDVPAPGAEVLSSDARQNKRVRNQLIKRSGYRFKYPGYRDGYGAHDK